MSPVRFYPLRLMLSWLIVAVPLFGLALIFSPPESGLISMPGAGGWSQTVAMMLCGPLVIVSLLLLIEAACCRVSYGCLPHRLHAIRAEV